MFSNHNQSFNPSYAPTNISTQDNNYSRDIEEACNSGASTIPLNAPLRHDRGYFLSLTDANSSAYHTSLESETIAGSGYYQRSPVSEVSTDISILSNTISPNPPTVLEPSTRRKSSPSVSRFSFNSNMPRHNSLPMSSYCTPLPSPSPFLLNLLKNSPDNDFKRTFSLRHQPRVVTPVIPDSPTSGVAFTFQMPNPAEHYVSPASHRACRGECSSPMSPPSSPDYGANMNSCREKTSQRKINSRLYVNQPVDDDETAAHDASYTPPSSNKSTPDSDNNFMKNIFLPKRSSSYESLGVTTENSYIDMSPNKSLTKPINPLLGRGIKPSSMSDLGDVDNLGYHHMTSPETWSRHSGLSGLSDISGVLSESTLDLDYTPSQSSC